MTDMEILQLFQWAGKLKTIKRTGWVNNKIQHPESVADHTFRVGFIAMFLAKEMSLNPLKMLQMSLLHDFAESLVGDITPYCGVSVEEKHRREKSALKELLKNIEDKEHWFNLWNEYEEQKTKEAIALKNIDKLEMAIQAIEYSADDADKDLSNFLSDANRNITLPNIRALFKELIDSHNLSSGKNV